MLGLKADLLAYIRAFPEPILLVDPGGQVLAANEAATLCWQEHGLILRGRNLAQLLQQPQTAVQTWLNRCQQSCRMLASAFDLGQRERAGSVIEGIGLNCEGKALILVRLAPASCQGEIQYLQQQVRRLEEELERQRAYVRQLQDQRQTLERQKQQLERLAEQDCLTALGNRRFFESAAARLWQQAHTYGYSLTFALLDVDYFKAYNDCYGHLAGDAVLQRVAQVLKASFRAEDVLARYGGEEFSLVLPQVSGELALAIVRRGLEGVRALQIRPAKGVNLPYLSLSAGLCYVALPLRESHWQSALAVADTALYQAKQQGRDRCFLLEWSS
ncbi:MAG: GGDEF domain-containing protein [Thermosynechococcus sp.]|uniref:diguanylate cyclase n=1 Tax=Thermosynechococcus sp. TaxID=2814275 RepID=UPI00220D44A8|nr:diguanylate cyclase [Thermosynechococcus sp.]BCX12668.1 MAG: GGDEF domain-containing protein [Thermosynechococcus sp.]